MIAAVYESYRKVFQATAERATLQTGAIEILKALKRAGFKISIATMRYTKSVAESELKHLAITPQLDLLLTRQDLAVKGTVGSLEETVNQRARLLTRALRGISLTADEL